MKHFYSFILGSFAGAATLSVLQTVLSQSYDLIVIDETETPLGAGPVGSGYYLYAVLTVLLTAMLAALAVWVTRRNSLKVRLLELRQRAGNTDTKVPLSIKALKDAIAETEAEISAIML